MSWFMRLLVLLSFAVGVTGCGDDGDYEASFVVTPAELDLHVGETAQLSLSDPNNESRDIPATFVSGDASVVSVDAAGKVLALKVGETTIVVTDEYTEDSTLVPVTVSAAAPGPTATALSVTPDTLMVGIGQVASLRATATYSDNTTREATTEVMWSSSDEDIARVGANSGAVEGISFGTVTITATGYGLTQTVTVTVVTSMPQLITIQVTPPASAITIGNVVQFTATGFYADGSSANVTNQALWASSAPSIVIVNQQGLATGVSAGTATISAAFESRTGTAGLVVAQGKTLNSVSVTSPAATLRVGEELQFSATANWSDGSSEDVTSRATWSTSSPSVATIGANTGLVRGIGAGAARMSATFDAHVGTADVVVVQGDQPVPMLTVSPSTLTLDGGESAQLTALAAWPDGGIENVTASASWFGADGGVVIVQSTGVVTGHAAGTETVTAQWHGYSASAAVTVVIPIGPPPPPSLVSVVVAPTGATLLVTETVQLTATAYYSDGSQVDVTADATWSSASPNVASVSAGLVTALTAGDAVVSASFTSGLDTASGTANVTVSAAHVPVSLEITPSSAVVTAGLSTSLQASVHYADGVDEVPSGVIWSSDDSDIATVDSDGMVQGLTPGSVTIHASWGGLNASVSVVVTSEVLNSITLSASSLAVVNGLTTTLSAVGYYTTGARDVTADVTFSVLPAGIFTIVGVTAQATATGSFPQSATVSASLGPITSDPLMLVVTSPTLVSLAISPSSPTTLGVGASRAYSATGTYSDGSVADVTATATWSASPPSILTVNSNGQASGIAEGLATLSASLGGVNAPSLALTVIRVPTGVYVNCTTPGYPGDPMDPSTQGGLRCLPSAYGYQVQCTASAYYAGMGISDVTSSATFSSANTAVASVGSDGVSNGLTVRWINIVGVGTATIRATLDGVSSTATGTIGSDPWVLQGGDVDLSWLSVGPIGSADTTLGNPIDFYAMGEFLGAAPCELPYSRDFYRQATWTSSNHSVASDPVEGRMTPAATGTTTIRAAMGTDFFGDVVSTVNP